jgi:N utilization substance protein B
MDCLFRFGWVTKDNHMNARSQLPKKGIARSAARLAAVQALYQHQMEATPEPQLLDEFHRHRLGAEIEDVQMVDADRIHFDDVVKGVLARITEIDALVSEKLAEGWRLDRLDKTMVQVLRAGAYEVIAREDIPAAAIITEYVDVAHAFFEEREAKFVNGVLDALAKSARKA